MILWEPFLTQKKHELAGQQLLKTQPVHFVTEAGKMSRNHFKASELMSMPCAKPNHEQKPNWRY